MKKFVGATAILYGLVAFSIGMVRVVDLWGTTVTNDLVREALSTGLVWPATLVHWVT